LKEFPVAWIFILSCGSHLNHTNDLWLYILVLSKSGNSTTGREKKRRVYTQLLVPSSLKLISIIFTHNTKSTLHFRNEDQSVNSLYVIAIVCFANHVTNISMVKTQSFGRLQTKLFDIIHGGPFRNSNRTQRPSIRPWCTKGAEQHALQRVTTTSQGLRDELQHTRVCQIQRDYHATADDVSGMYFLKFLLAYGWAGVSSTFPTTRSVILNGITTAFL
jgi:hypothetical protein